MPGRLVSTPPTARLLRLVFLLLIFSLPFAQHDFEVAGFPITSTDILFLVAAGAVAVGFLRAEIQLRWEPIFAALLLYFMTMLPSLGVGELRSWLKLASQAYLLSLPVLANIIIENEDDLRAAVLTWLGATAVCCLIGMVTVALFWLGVDRSVLAYGLHKFGTLPPGNYPRIDATFDFPAMLCNYLTVSLMMLLVARERHWIDRRTFIPILALIVVTAIFSLTPGLGGIILAMAIWEYLRLREGAAWRARRMLLGGITAAVAFVLAAAVTPFITSTTPFVFQLPWGGEVAPAVRLLTWIEAATRFLANPVFGAGIASDAAAVLYVDPSGTSHLVTDAHNMFLNVAVQFGIAGLAAIIVLIAAVTGRVSKLAFEPRNMVAIALAIAWLDAFVYQGLTGSYEDARHLWVLLGLFLASYRIAVTSPRSR